ncbi:MAG: DUF2066 domain-containing protein, partial [Pseudomonas aeruginosa]|nr:DUF2066 domain-containing protein [Pseudomonas aeruginosa]
MRGLHSSSPPFPSVRREPSMRIARLFVLCFSLLGLPVFA